MADAARREYRALVYETPGFVDFWRAVTPIDEISALHIGSRPTARRGGGLQPTAIRAIPWVFSWMQSRFNLPGLIERSHHPAGDLARAARQTDRRGSTPARVSVAPQPGFTVA